MEPSKKEMNTFLVKTFHDILKIEEMALKNCTEGRVSIKEFHLLETVYKLGVDDGDNTAGNIAAELRITPGTLTTAVKNLERKGYIERKVDTLDRRSVHISVTPKGEEANLNHEKFHDEMLEAILDALDSQETAAFLKGLKALVDFFERKDIK